MNKTTDTHTTNQTIATICARGGSKGLPLKNIKIFAEKPLIVHTIELALMSPSIDSVWVSTDDEAIADIARRAGAQVPYIRPAALATDDAPKLPVIEHLVQHIESCGMSINRVVDLQPTSPLRTVADIEGAIVASDGVPLLASVRAASDNPYFNLVELDNMGVAHLSKGNGTSRRQDSPRVCALNGSIYVWQRNALKQASTEGLWSVKMGVFEMPAWRSVDIDNLEDFEYAQWLYSRHFFASNRSVKGRL